MATLVSPGVSVTITDESFYIPASATTVPLFFIATRADKTKADGVTAAPGALENGVVRTITGLKSSVDTYGVPFFRTTGALANHGDCRNEYGLFALNQALGIISYAYVVRANVDLADADVTTYVATSPVLTGTGNGTLGSLTVNQATAVAELWTMTMATATVDISIGTPGVITWTAHGLQDGTPIKFSTTGALPTGIVAGTIYYVKTPLTNTFNIAATAGGIVINTTGSQSGTQTVTLSDAFKVVGATSGNQAQAIVGTPYNSGIVAFTITAGGTPFAAGDYFTFTVSANVTSNPLGVGDAAKRATIVAALASQINSNTDVRSDVFEYNIIICPGYHEVADELQNLNVAIQNEAYIISSVPFNKTPEETATWGVSIARRTGDDIGYYYAHGLASNLDGVDCFIDSSGIALRTICFSDDRANVWFPPAGPRRGIVTGVSDIGYVTGTLGTATTFVSAPLTQGQRDVLYNYSANINPIPFIPGRGIMVLGDKTSQAVASALDRINVSRLLKKIKRDVRKAAFAYLFELNDRITRESIKAMIDGYLHDIMQRRGLYDYLVLCDESNNTPVRIDRNELWVDIAVKPPKSINFIYIPIKVVSTGAAL